jgi:hypothetical protein
MVTTPLYLLDPQDPAARACQRCGMRGVALFGVLEEPMLADVHSHHADRAGSRRPVPWAE